ncbi:hypothetical protein WMY93_032080 [Mugilogobius chulae]|uniref:Integrase catalytic domain-containing protein n=1 Tax=Mugilogobius chulae TaxID=88201 RepID=A0AAW0MES8_9GOBI
MPRPKEQCTFNIECVFQMPRPKGWKRSLAARERRADQLAIGCRPYLSPPPPPDPKVTGTGRRHSATKQNWPVSAVTKRRHKLVIPPECPGKKFVFVIGHSHLRAIVDGFVRMPEGCLSFGFSSTPGGSANDLHRELMQIALPREPDLVLLLAPCNNLHLSPTITDAGTEFGLLLSYLVGRFQKVLVLDFPTRIAEDLEIQNLLRQEFRRVAAVWKTRYFPVAEHFPVDRLELWSDGTHLSDDHGMGIYVQLMWQACYMELETPAPAPKVSHPPTRPSTRRVQPMLVVTGPLPRTPPPPSEWTPAEQGRKKNQRGTPKSSPGGPKTSLVQPERIHSDQGANFESQLIKELLEMAGVQKSHTTPYHPMGNGIAERYNRTLGNMIRALPPNSKARWPQMLQTLTFCYNCTEHETTGFAPFYLMFGRIPRLPMDVVFQHVLHNNSVVDHCEFVARLRRDLAEAARIAQKHSRSEQVRQAENYNHKVKGSPLAVGDRVLLANRGERGKRKVADKRDSKIYEVLSVKPEINVYSIKDPDTQRVKVVHRNLLLPLSFLPVDDGDPSESDCPSLANAVIPDSEIPVEVQDSETKTINWLMQSNSVSDVNTVASQDSFSDVDPVEGQSVAADVEKDTNASFSQPRSSESGPAHTQEKSEQVVSDPVDTVVDMQPQPLCTRTGRKIQPPARNMFAG